MPEDPERALTLLYAPASARAGLAALFGLDDALGQLIRTTREPALGQIRLAWWRDRLAALDRAPPPGEPVLQAIAAEVVPRGATGAALSTMTEAWELLLEPELDTDALRRFGQVRGGVLFAAAAALLNLPASDPTSEAGAGWALADLALHLSDERTADAARAIAEPLLEAARRHRWSRAGRPLGALAHLARLDLAAGARRTGAPGRVARLLWHRMTGG